jgi:hypothetical protein
MGWTDTQVVQHAIHPGIAITDFLIFERPIPTARRLLLRLPITNCGGRGSYTFEILTKTIKGR